MHSLVLLPVRLATRNPARQLSHMLAPAADTLSLAHGSQTFAAVAPIALLAVPATHAVQTGAAIAALHVPVGHDVHAVDRDSLKLPAAQSMQVLEELAYLPAAHATHASALASGTRPTSHALHSVAVNADVYVPASHRVHADAMVTFEYLPGAQSSHVLAPAELDVPA